MPNTPLAVPQISHMHHGLLRPSTPIQACNASTLPMQGKGGSYSNSRDARVAPLPLHPIPQGADFHRPVEITLLWKFTLPNLSA
jgi:hypothetical protein